MRRRDALRLLRALSVARRRFRPETMVGELRLENAELALDALDESGGYRHQSIHPALPGRPGHVSPGRRPELRFPDDETPQVAYMLGRVHALLDAAKGQPDPYLARAADILRRCSRDLEAILRP